MTSTLQDILLRVKESADIVQIVGQYVPLKRAGSRYLGLCPFHNDRHPSMNVNPRIGIYKCFVCGSGGDVIKFVQEYERIGFADALRQVASKAGIAIPESLSFGDKGVSEKTTAILQANAIALQVYSETLEKSPQALEYLRERGLDKETVKHFQIGVAPEAPDLILQKALVKKVPTAGFIEAGILGESASGRIFDRFGGRLIFPIFNLSGKVIGFGGRVFPGREGAKYVNTPESPLYQKSRVLFGFNFARTSIDSSKEVVLVEGYMDLVSLWQAGVHNAVAVCGTALTKEHVQMLARFARKAVLFFDGDMAGRQAVMRSLEPLLAQGIEVRIPLLKENEDPDSYIKSHDAAALKTLLLEAEDLTGFLRRDFGKKNESMSPEEKDKLVRDTTALLANAPSIVVREEHVAAMRQSLGLRSLPPATPRLRRNEPAVQLSSEMGLFVPGYSMKVSGETKPEWRLLQIVLAYPYEILKEAEALDLNWFSDDRVRDLMDHALALLSEGGTFSLRDLRERLPESLQEALASLDIPEGELPEFVLQLWADHVTALEIRFLQREKRQALNLEKHLEIQKRIQVLHTRKGGIIP